MKKTIILLILFCACSLSLSAQKTYSIKGTVVDTNARINLQTTSVMVLNAKDSILRRFTWTAADGSFVINNLNEGRYILLLSYPDYADYTEEFVLDDEQKEHNLGKISVSLKSKLLQDVIIKGEVTAIKIKGDTTEFNARAYVIQPNDKVEDLIKQFPGIEVDKNGKITAQGKAVNKVLLDGEEFFGDDPTLVTQNIRADMVDKVQLFDKKSDQAVFSGIDDGKKIKTLNIVLKEDKKSGYFGKTDAGLATDKYYQAQAMLNSFEAKRKFAIFGTTGNTGKITLGADDGSKYGTSSFIGPGAYTGTADELEPYDGRYDGRGIPLSRAGGVHYDDKWNSDKVSINTNYKIGSLSVDGSNSSTSQNPLPTDFTTNHADQNTYNYVFRQRLDAVYKIQLDSTSALNISIDGTSKNSESRMSEMASSVRADDTYFYKTARNSSNTTIQKRINASLLWSKKFKKPRRTMTFLIVQSTSDDERKGYLNTTNQFYNASNLLDSVQHIDQYKTINISTSAWNSNLTYTEPISKTLSLGLNYGLNINNSSYNRMSFNKSPAGKYETPDTAYTNDIDYKQVSNSAGLNFTFNKNKTNLTIGTNMIATSYNQADAYTKVQYKRSYLNWSPRINYVYRFSQQKALGISYDGSTVQPRTDQLQPVKVNDDPLNIVSGNPDLKPSYSNSVGVFYNSYKVVSSQSFSMYSYYGFSINPITSNITTDATGKRIRQWINTPGKAPANFQFRADMSKKYKSNIQLGLMLSTNVRTEYNFINNVINKIQAYNYSGRLSVSKNVLKKYNFSASLGPNYSISKQSLLKDFNDNKWGYSSSGSLTVYLPGKTEISTNANYTYIGANAYFDENTNPLIWNSTISKKFFKSENLKLSVSGNDLLNQNIGFSRGAFSQNSYTTIRRYFMLSLTWDFSKMGAPQSKK